MLFLCLWGGVFFLVGQLDAVAAQLYVTITLFVLLVSNLGKRLDGPSAYSVFNEGCQALLGTMRAEQFDNEIRRRPIDIDQPEQVTAGGSGGPGLGSGPGHDDVLAQLRAEMQAQARTRRRARESDSHLRTTTRRR